MEKSKAWDGDAMVLLRSPYLLLCVSVTFVESVRALYGLNGMAYLARKMGINDGDQ